VLARVVCERVRIGVGLCCGLAAHGNQEGEPVEVLRRVWWGQYSLPRAFWGFYVLGCAAAFICVALVLVASYRLRVGTLGFLLAVVLINGYWIVVSVGVWRSASAAKHSPGWAIAAKAVVCISVARVLWYLANGGALFLMDRLTAGIDV
jgi:hypothetical protein